MTAFPAAAALVARLPATWIAQAQATNPAQGPDVPAGAAPLLEQIRSAPGLVLISAAAILFALSVIFAFEFLRRVPNDPLRIESHWGGFGGGVEGWRMSASLGMLVAAISFGTMFTVIAQGLAGKPEQDQDLAEAADTVAAEPGPADSVVVADSAGAAQVLAAEPTAPGDTTSLSAVAPPVGVRR